MRTVTVDKYRRGDHDALVVDATQYVPDRQAFARAHCDRETGVDHPDASQKGATVALFCALETHYTPPRAVLTAVHEDAAATDPTPNETLQAADWVLDRVDGDAVMLDTFAGTRRAQALGPEVAVEIADSTRRPPKRDARLGEPLADRPAYHSGAVTHVYRTTLPICEPTDSRPVEDDADEVEGTAEPTARTSR